MAGDVVMDAVRRLNSLMEVGYRRGSRWFVLCNGSVHAAGTEVGIVYPVRFVDGSDGCLVVGDRILGGSVRFAAHVGAIEFVDDGTDSVHRVYDVVSGCWLGIGYRRSIGVVAYRTLAVIDAGSDDVMGLVTEFIRPMMLGISRVPSIGLWVDGGSVYLEQVDVLPLWLAKEEALKRGERAIYAVEGVQWFPCAYDIGRWIDRGGVTIMCGSELVGAGSVVWVDS